jgi:hypothetical protein
MSTTYFILQYAYDLKNHTDIQQCIDTFNSYHIPYQIYFINNQCILQGIYKFEYTESEDLYHIYRILNSLVNLDQSFTYRSYHNPITLDDLRDLII